MGTVIREDSRAGRPRIRIAGTVRVIRNDRIGGAPALEAELQNGPGRIDLIWLGRAAIPGIEPGSAVVAEGRVGVRRGRATMFNPRYELTAAGSAAPGPAGAARPANPELL